MVNSRCSYTFFQDADNYGIMMGHYLLLWSQLNRCIFFTISYLLSKWSIISFEKSIGGGARSGIIINLLYPLMGWLCVKYHFHFPYELLLHTFTTRVLVAMAYIYNCFKGGLAWQRLEQWETTLTIFNMIILIFRALVMLIGTNVDCWILPLLYSLGGGLALFRLCKDYVEEFVVLQKV